MESDKGNSAFRDVLTTFTYKTSNDPPLADTLTFVGAINTFYIIVSSVFKVLYVHLSQ